MEPIRERIEEFVRRYWREGNRVLRVLAVAVTTIGGGPGRTKLARLTNI